MPLNESNLGHEAASVRAAHSSATRGKKRLDLEGFKLTSLSLFHLQMTAILKD